ncbi:hypothetical protein DXG01_016646 [Tephrocybe rancida]|nr:hypothetical protein DXG01_016646 [Tephrocybe rancida]
MEDLFKDYKITDEKMKMKYICDFADAVSVEEWKSMKAYMDGTYEEFTEALPKRYGELRHHKEGSLLELKRDLRPYKGIDSDDMSLVLALNRTMQRHAHKLLKDPTNLSITSGGLAKLYLECLSPTFRQSVKQTWMVWQTTPEGQKATKGRRVDDPWTIAEIMESAEKVAANGQLFEEEEVELISGPLLKGLTKDVVKKESPTEFLTVAKLLVERMDRVERALQNQNDAPHASNTQMYVPPAAAPRRPNPQYTAGSSNAGRLNCL